MSPHAIKRLYQLYRKVFARNRAADRQRCAYPATLSSQAVPPLVEHLEPRLMLSGVTALSVTDGNLTEGAEQALMVTADATDFDRWEIRWGVGATRAFDLNSDNVTTIGDSVSVTDTFVYGDDGVYGITATAIYQGETETTGQVGLVYHGPLGDDTVSYLMYSDIFLSERTIDGPSSEAWTRAEAADDHLTMVKYSRGWFYYTGSAWQAFTSEPGDLLLARMNHYDGEIISLVDQSGLEADNMEFGFADGTLTHHTFAEAELSIFLFDSNTFTRNGATSTVTQRVDITNANPAIDSDATSVTAAAEGGAVYLDLNFTDAGLEDRHSVRVDWGDGSTDTDLTAWTQISQDSETGLWLDTHIGSAELAHIYDTAGVYDVTITVTDDDGGVSTDLLVDNVSVSAPAATPATSVTSILHGSHLVIRGTEGRDYVKLTSFGGTTTLHLNGRRITSWSQVTETTIYGFGGDDVIITAGVASPVIYGGGGDDTLTLYQPSSNWGLHGGGGNDVLMVAADNYQASGLVRGDAGLDRFFVSDPAWVDDPSTQEMAEEQLFKTTTIVDAAIYPRGDSPDWTSAFNSAVTAARGTGEMAADEWAVVFVGPGTYEFGVADRTDGAFDVRQPLVEVPDHVAIVGSGSRSILTFTDDLRTDWKRSILGARAESGENYGVFNLTMTGRALQTEMQDGFNQYVDAMTWNNNDQPTLEGDLGKVRNIRLEKLTLKRFPGSGITLLRGVERVRVRDVAYSDCHYSGIYIADGRASDIVIERTEQRLDDDPSPRWGINIEVSSWKHDPDLERVNNLVFRDSILRSRLDFDGVPDNGRYIPIENIRILDNDIHGLVNIKKARHIEIRGNTISSDAMAPTATGLVVHRHSGTHDHWQNLLRIGFIVDDVDIRGNTVVAFNGALGGIAVSPNELANDSPARDVVIANNTVITPSFGINVKGGQDPTGEDAAGDSHVRNVTVTGNHVIYDPDTANSGVSLTSVHQGYEVGNTSVTVDTGPWVSSILLVEESGIDPYRDLVGPRRNNVVDKMVIHFNERVDDPASWTDAVRIFNHRTQEYLDLPTPDTSGYSDLGGYEVSRTSDPEFDDIGSVWTFSWDSPWEPGFHTIELVADEIISVADGKTMDGNIDWAAGGNYVQELLIAMPGDANFDGAVDQTDLDWVNLVRRANQGPTLVDIGDNDFVAEFDLPYPHHSYLQMGLDDSFDTTGSFSLSFSANEFDDADSYKFFKQRTDSTTQEVTGWWLQGDIFTITDGANTYSLAMGQSGATWRYLAIVVDAGETGSDGEIRIYPGGGMGLIASKTIPAGFDYTKAGAAGTALFVGDSSTHSTTSDYDGQMDNVCMATRELSLQELGGLYSNNTTPTVIDDEIVSHWKFDNNWDDSGLAGLGANPWSGTRRWGGGDFDRDNDVDQHDLAVVIENIGTSAVGPASFNALTTDDSTPVLTGHLSVGPGAVSVSVTVAGRTVGTFRTSDGNWSTSEDFVPPLPTGTHDVTVTIRYQTSVGLFATTDIYVGALTIDPLASIIE
jgi:hypothetical protein